LTSSTALSSIWCWMFDSNPLLKSSTTRTAAAPRSSRESTRCDPMNDAPPVTRTRLDDQLVDTRCSLPWNPHPPDWQGEGAIVQADLATCHAGAGLRKGSES